MPARLGPHLQRLRRDAGLTQQQAADLAGLSIGALRDIEQGRITTPRPATLRRLAEALRLTGVDTGELLRLGQPDQLPDGSLWLQILGPVALQVDGAAVELGSTRQRTLLGILALAANSPVSQERLIEAIWGSRPPRNVADLLQANATRLRRRLRALGGDRAPQLVTAPGTYRLAITDNQLDLLLFRQRYQQAEQAQQAGDPVTASRLLADGIALWRGGPVADLPALRDDPEVANLSREWSSAAVAYATAALELDRPDDALRLLWRVVRADPLHEAAYARLLVALSMTGQPASASRLYEQLRHRLADELGTDPGPELARAYRAVQRGRRPPTVAPAATVRSQLPPDPAEFTGRAAELAALHAAAAAGAGTAAGVLVIAGTAGAGKTALAVHFVHQLLAAGRYPDRQLYVHVGGQPGRPPEPAAVLAMVLRLLGVGADQLPPDLSGRAALYRDRLSGQRAVLLVDGVPSEQWLLPLLPASPTSLVVLTSRRSLALDGSRVVTLAAFPPADAARLLARIAGAERVTGDPEGARRLVELCGQLPLAVTLAGRRLRARPGWRPADLAERLAGCGDRLAELAAGSDQLRATLDASYQPLAPDERRLLRLLGGHPREPVSVAEAATLLGVPDTAARRLLDRLVDEHLATMEAGDRYRLPPLVRQYAADRWRAGEAGNGAADRPSRPAAGMRAGSAARPGPE